MIRCSHGFLRALCQVKSCPHYGAEPAWESDKRVRDRKRHRDYRSRRAAAKQEPTR